MIDLFKIPVDNLTIDWNNARNIKERYANFKWYDVYDFIEFIANTYNQLHTNTNKNFMNYCNAILEKEVSAYRFINGKIAQITSESEINEIEEAINIGISTDRVKDHLKQALDMLANRKNPDYRNSIKESISAVESLCKTIVKNNNSTLGQALKLIESRVRSIRFPTTRSCWAARRTATSGSTTRTCRAATPRSGPNGLGWTVVDLDSTNGIEVGGKRVKELALTDGTRFTVGTTEISFRRRRRIACRPRRSESRQPSLSSRSPSSSCSTSSSGGSSARPRATCACRRSR